MIKKYNIKRSETNMNQIMNQINVQIENWRRIKLIETWKWLNNCIALALLLFIYTRNL